MLMPSAKFVLLTPTNILERGPKPPIKYISSLTYTVEGRKHQYAMHSKDGVQLGKKVITVSSSSLNPSSKHEFITVKGLKTALAFNQ
ncbi:hypothetical protein SLE2022_388010 [Rubroshorea leprosula]